MTQEIDIHSAGIRDLGSLRQLYIDAFPDEDLFPLVTRLIMGTVPVQSLMATCGGKPVGHVIFTPCTVDPGGIAASLLGPLCVSTGLQKRGIGSALVRSGLDQLRATVSQVLVLGDPRYYARFGFKPDHLVESPCPIPLEWKGAWQSVQLDGGAASSSGRLIVPEAWSDPALWSD